MGLCRDGRRLAVGIDLRDARDAVRQVAFEWNVDELEEVLKDVGFEQVEVQARYRDRRAVRWTFLALRAGRRDYVPIKIEDADLGILELEASRHRRQGRKEQAREAIKPERRQSVAVRSQEATEVRGKGAKGAVAEAGHSGPESPRDPFEDLLTLEGNVATGSEAGDNPMIGNKRQAAAVAPVAKKPKQPRLALPPGATVISNDGRGNCPAADVAQALTSHGGKQVSHRGVRRAMTKWMREQASHLQPLWDGRDTSDQPCQQSFAEYLSDVEAVGSWCVNLEVYAMSRGLPANLLVLDFDSETTFKFASQADSDPFIVLKFSSKHYEWIKCSPEALVDIWCHAAVGNTAGGRGGGFMCIDTASETSVAAVAPAAGVLEGGRTPRMVIDTASSGGSGASLSLHCLWRLHGGHMVFDDLSAVGSGLPSAAGPSSSLAGDLDSVRAHRPSRSWPTPADLRSLSSASSTRPAVLPPRRRLRSKTNHWVSLSAVAKAGADVEVPVEAEPLLELSVPEHLGYQPKRSKYRVGAVVRWPCPLCPMVIETTSPDTLQKRRYDHCHRQHGGQGLPGMKRVNFDAFRTLGPDEPEDWRCPLCNWGLPVGTRGGMTSKTFAAAKERHRKAKRRHISRQEYLAKIKARGARKPAHRMRARVRLLNAGVAKRQKEGLAAIPLDPFPAWSCMKCGMCTRVAKRRQLHERHCHAYDKSILEGVRARHRESYEEAKTLGHGVDPDLLTQLYVNADLAMGGDGQLS
ncbi:RNR1 [Symbiodinium sp. KB8]|nr:RNR1 [Symbiodinium sp. KB8]